MTTNTERVLVIGVVPEVNRRVVEQLNALGFSAVGCTNVPNAATDFHGRDFDLVTMGSGVDAVTRRGLHEAFERQGARVLDVFGPIAVQQITWALRGARNAGWYASAFSVEEDGQRLTARVTTLRDCR